MWKAIKCIGKSIGDLSMIVGKETRYQVKKVSDSTGNGAEVIASKTAKLRADYEQHLLDRKKGIKKPEVVKDAPEGIIEVN
jgi:hypothetical protein